MKVYSAAIILPDGRTFSIRYLLAADELAGLQAAGILGEVSEVVGMQQAADGLVAHWEKQSFIDNGGNLQ